MIKTQKRDLVIYNHGERIVVGEAVVDQIDQDTVEITARVTDPKYRLILEQGTLNSLSVSLHEKGAYGHPS